MKQDEVPRVDDGSLADLAPSLKQSIHEVLDVIAMLEFCNSQYILWCCGLRLTDVALIVTTCLITVCLRTTARCRLRFFDLLQYLYLRCITGNHHQELPAHEVAVHQLGVANNFFVQGVQ